MKGNVMTNANFGKYQFLVEQELAHYKELIASKGFLSGAFSLEGYEITHSQKTAYDLYTDQDPPLPYVSYPELIGNVVPSNFIPFYEFQDIRDKIRSLWMELDDDIWDYVRSEVSNRNLHLKELKDIDITPIITPFDIDDDTEMIRTLMEANGGKPLLSQREAMQRFGITDPEAQLKQIKDEENNKLNEASI